MPEKKSVPKTKGDDRIYVNGVPLHMKGVLVVNPEIGDGHVKNVKPVMCFFRWKIPRPA